MGIPSRITSRRLLRKRHVPFQVGSRYSLLSHFGDNFGLCLSKQHSQKKTKMTDIPNKELIYNKLRTVGANKPETYQSTCKICLLPSPGSSMSLVYTGSRLILVGNKTPFGGCITPFCVPNWHYFQQQLPRSVVRGIPYQPLRQRGNYVAISSVGANQTFDSVDLDSVGLEVRLVVFLRRRPTVEVTSPPTKTVYITLRDDAPSVQSRIFC
ncbi:hypothetical protein BJ170DRAFT_711700 [Xylariales sp. AK1849]|nr:hypothetical protein BJ170DRAFT_711700 [Xylariales sp. AK1849]